jgi:diguanylate cyclase (GGDEF)-like protein
LVIMTKGRDSRVAAEKLPVFIYEPHEAARRRAENASTAAGYELVLARTTEEATAALEGARLSGLLLADSDAAVEIGQYVREFTSIDAPVAVIVDSDEEDPEARVAAASADSYVRRPITAASLELFVGLSAQLTDLRRQLAEQTPAEEASVPGVAAYRRPLARSGFHHFDDIKDLLVVEVRRAKRYGYPLSVLLVRLDPIPAIQQIDRPDLPREITAGLAVAIARSIRVIDLPIHYADDSILVFLPHTDLAGAEEVGRRVKRRIKRITYRDEALLCQLTASVGVAGISAGDNLSFAKLIKNATSALRAAQLKGGDRVMKRVNTRATSQLNAIETAEAPDAASEAVAVVAVEPASSDPPVGDSAGEAASTVEEGARAHAGDPSQPFADGPATLPLRRRPRVAPREIDVSVDELDGVGEVGDGLAGHQSADLDAELGETRDIAVDPELLKKTTR